MKLAVIHFGLVSGDRESPAAVRAALDANENSLLALNLEAAREGADLILNPELPLIWPDPQTSPIRRSSAAADVAASRQFAWWFARTRRPQFLGRLRQEIVQPFGCVVVTSVIAPVRGHKLLYSAGVLLGPGDVEHLYHKRALTSDVVYAAPGASPLEPVSLPFGKVGVLVCADYSFPLLARSLALNGADLIVIPAQLSSGVSSHLSVRALENGVPLALANCFLRDHPAEGGESAIVAADGKVLASQPPGQPEDRILYADLDLECAAAVAAKAGPMRARRPELYQGALSNLTSSLLRSPVAGAGNSGVTASGVCVVTVSGKALREAAISPRADTKRSQTPVAGPYCHPERSEGAVPSSLPGRHHSTAVTCSLPEAQDGTRSSCMEAFRLAAAVLDRVLASVGLLLGTPSSVPAAMPSDAAVTATGFPSGTLAAAPAGGPASGPLFVVLPEFTLTAHQLQRLIDRGRAWRAYLACAYEEEDARVLALFDPDGREVLRYTKVHLTPDERDLYRPGSSLESYIDLPAGRVGLLSGHDLLYPEAVEIQRNAGVDLLLVPSCLEIDSANLCEDIARSRKVNVAAAELHHRGGVYRRYPKPWVDEPLTANRDSVNTLTFDLTSGFAGVAPVERSGTEVVLRLPPPIPLPNFAQAAP